MRAVGRRIMSMSPDQTAAVLERLSPLRPELAIVLGSGFQGAAPDLQEAQGVAYDRLPGFPRVRVAGHAGRLLIGRLARVPVLVLCGRAHFYEGHDLDAVTFPIRVLAAFGVRSVLLTSAAGGINRRYRPGDFMVFNDHLNFMGANPLRGVRSPEGMPFIDLCETYDPTLRRLLRAAARAVGARLRFGVYLAVAGPSYETPAEIRAFARLGADAVGMSTVPEAIVARQCGLATAAMSLITNRAASYSGPGLSHTRVLGRAAALGGLIRRLLTEFVRRYGQDR
jgi:purine-nucleoside phosphorylase